GTACFYPQGLADFPIRVWLTPTYTAPREDGLASARHTRIHLLHMSPLRNEYNGSKACNDADPCPTLRTRVHRISLPAPLDTQAGTKVQTRLSDPNLAKPQILAK